jgi:Putative binding domain, N-terminal
VPWISITAGASGSGSGSVAFRVDANTGAARSGTIAIADKTLTVSQAGSCTYSIDSTAQSIGAAGGAGTAVAVTAAAGCTWSATSSVPWISITAGGSGSGSGSVAFRVDANTGAARSGTIAIADKTLTVSQAAGCSYSIGSMAQSIGAAGGAGTPVSVSAAAGCLWTASSAVPWITITAGAAGDGNGSVAFTVAANTATTRVGSLTIAGFTFTVTQASGCSYAVSPAAISVPAAAGSAGPIVVTSGAGCPWTASTTASWIAFASAASGSGSGSVSLNVLANTGIARTGTVTIEGQTVTVSQAAAPAPPACSYAISPTSMVVDRKKETYSVSVSAAAGCAWTASIASGGSWIVITSGHSGTGNGTVSFSLDPNNDPPRTATLTIAGQTFTVTQDSK